MGLVKSITNSYSWNEYLFWYIQRKDILKIQWVLDNKPTIINAPLTINFKTTPLHRAAVNGSLEVCKLLVQKYNADINYTNQLGQTPLMGAAKRDKVEVVKYLLTMGANTQLQNSNGLLAVQFAILGGFYETALVIFEKMKNKQLKNPLDYEEIGKQFLYRYVNYGIFVENILLQTDPQNVPCFLTRQKKVFSDPVVDPRETWKKWFLRQMEFKDPPLCQRSELPEQLQPQNRRFGKIKYYLSKIAMSRLSQKPQFYPKTLSDIDSRDKIFLMKELGNKSEKLQQQPESKNQSF